MSSLRESRSRRFGLLFLACSVGTALCTPPLFAQETIQFATIGGRVLDPSGAVVESAKVGVRQTETNLSAEAVTDREGRFRFAYLKLGPYEVTIHKDGFADATRALTLTVGSAFDVPVTLAVGAGASSVTVSGQAEVLEASRSQVAGTVLAAEVNSLPLNGRNFLDLALLVPGVSPTNTASTQLFPETSAVTGQGISVGSQRNFSNSFIVDGLSANDDAAGLIGTSFGLDVVNEVQVVTSGGQAEFGRALGGYVNMVTRSGTNGLHGSLYGYFRNQRMNANNALSASKLPLTQAQYGATIGGPLRKDRTFYFGNFERRSLNQSGLITIAPANVAAINARLDAVGYQGPRVVTGQYANPVKTNNLLAKVDHQFNSRDLFTARYSVYSVNSSNSRGVGALSSVSAAAGLADTDHTIAMSNITTISPRTVNEARGQFTHSDLAAEPNDGTGPSVSISGVASFGRLAGSPTGRVTNTFEVVDNLAHQIASHALRAGISFLYNDTTIRYPRQIRGSYSFSSLANFLIGTYNNLGYSQTFGTSVVSQTNPNIGFYAQDEWKPTRSLTFNLGLRYDLQYLQEVNTDTNNVSPRIGFAWSPFKSRQTVIRGGYGLFYDRVPLRALANALLSANNTTVLTSTSQLSFAISPTQVGAPVFPNILATAPTGVLANLTTMDRNLQNAYSEQGNFEIEQRIGRQATFSFGFQHLRGLHLVASVNQNVPSCVAAGTNNACRPNPNYANNSQYSSVGDSNYNGLHVAFTERPGRNGSFRLSYTYSKALNNVGEFFFSGPLDNFNLWRDYARSDDDQRHRFVLDGMVHTSNAPAKNLWGKVSHGFLLSGMLQYYSALPFNITTGSTTVQGTSARPTVNGVFINRNEGVGFGLVNLNARLSRNFALTERWKLEAIAEAFNALNHRNNMIPNGVFGAGAYPSAPSATFRQPGAVADPRTFQLALRLAF